MNLSDAVQIVQASPDILQVYFPPRYPGGIVALVLAVILAVLAAKSHNSTFRLWLFVAMGLVFLFMGLDLCTYHANVTLSAKNQTFAYEERTFYYRTAKSFPLISLEQAVVKSGSTQNRQIALLVASQPQIPLGDGYNSRGNTFEAAHAINAFIARNAQR